MEGAAWTLVAPRPQPRKPARLAATARQGILILLVRSCVRLFFGACVHAKVYNTYALTVAGSEAAARLALPWLLARSTPCLPCVELWLHVCNTQQSPTERTELWGRHPLTLATVFTCPGRAARRRLLGPRLLCRPCASDPLLFVGLEDLPGRTHPYRLRGGAGQPAELGAPWFPPSAH